MISQIKSLTSILSYVAAMLFSAFFVTSCASMRDHALSNHSVKNEEIIAEEPQLSARPNEVVQETNAEVAQKADSCNVKEDQSSSSQMSYLNEVIAHVLGKRQDPSIEFMSAEQLQQGFSALVFNEIPGSPPYCVKTRRLLQEDTEVYLPAIEPQGVLNGLDGTKVPFGVAMPTQEYLPGERVSWRICSSDGKILKEATCCPCPKIIRDASGKCLMEAALLAIDSPENTVYMLLFPAMKEVEYIFTSGNRPPSKGIIHAGKLRYTTFSPAIKDMLGGMSKIEIHCEGQSYQMELPWGNKLTCEMENSSAQIF